MKQTDYQNKNIRKTYIISFQSNKYKKKLSSNFSLLDCQNKEEPVYFQQP